MNDAIKAPLALTLICAGVCGALAFANDMTAGTIAATEAAALQENLTSAFGEAYYIALGQSYAGVEQVIKDTDGRVIFDIISTGYNTDGQHLLVGLDTEGKVCGIRIVSISDSPTQAQKVGQDSFLSQFTGWDAPDTAYSAVSGATKSSEGVRRAVALALETYQANREAITNG